MADAMIFDMDGTLANVSSIRHHITKPNRNFDAFHSESVNCPANTQPWWAAYFFGQLGMDILIVTARKEKYLYHTLWWLMDQQLTWNEIYMRGDKDGRPDYEVKRDILAQIRRDGYNPVLAFDDNPAVVALWEENNIPCIVVPGWEGDLTGYGEKD